MNRTTIISACSISTLTTLLLSAAFAAPQDEGIWSSVIDWPVNATNSLLTPQGNVMSISQGRVNIWNPDLGTNSPAHTIFSGGSTDNSNTSSAVLIPDTGLVLMAGGGNATGGTNNLALFDPISNTTQTLTNLKHSYYEPAMTVLGNGKIFISNDFKPPNADAIKFGEVFAPENNQTNSLVSASEQATMNGLGLIRPSRQWVAPTGKVAGIMNFFPNQLFSYDTEVPNLQITEALPEKFSYTSVEVMYQPGKILNVSKTLGATFKMNINSETPWMVETLTRPVTTARSVSTITMLPNGKVMIAGSTNPEIWDPETEDLSVLAAPASTFQETPRSLLLKDGRILLASYTNATVEIFSPPYLFDSSGQAAERPAITSAPKSAAYNSEVTIDYQSNNTISRVTLIKTGRSQYQRFMELDFEQTENGLNVQMPKYATDATPGFYLMYILDNNGVPSKGHIISMSASSIPEAYPVAIADAATSDGRAVTLNVLSNDTGGGLSLIAVNEYSEQGGTARIESNQIIFTPKAGFTGNDAFWYVIQDNQGRTNAAKVTISVTSSPTTPYPFAEQDNVITTTATRVVIDVLANDSGDGLWLTAPNAWSLNGGTVALVDNKLVYTSKAGFTGDDNIWYVFKDSQGRTNSGQVNITVQNDNSSPYPVANADYYNTSVNVGINLDILANDTGGIWRAIDTLYEYTAKGGKTYKTPEGLVWYVPKNGFTGEDNFWYVMIDSEGRKNSAQVKINVN